MLAFSDRGHTTQRANQQPARSRNRHPRVPLKRTCTQKQSSRTRTLGGGKSQRVLERNRKPINSIPQKIWGQQRRATLDSDFKSRLS